MSSSVHYRLQIRTSSPLAQYHKKDEGYVDITSKHSAEEEYGEIFGEMYCIKF